MATLNVITKILAYADATVSSNPRMKYVDWLRDTSGVPVSDPRSEAYTIEPGGSLAVFNGTRTLLTDGTTSLTLSVSTLDSSHYRLTWTGGTNPVFRTTRGLTLSGTTLTWVVNGNGTVTVTTNPINGFTNVAVGDTVFVPNTTTGDIANVLSVLNSGFWTVLGKASNSIITLVRQTGVDFEGIGETTLLTTNLQFTAYSAAGVQVGDFVDISAGFSITARKSFEIVDVTDTFIEFVSTAPLAGETALPGAAGLAVYSNQKTFLYVEADQECAVRVNGDIGNYQRMSPFDASDSANPAMYMRRGPTWSLSIVNLSAYSLNVSIMHAE